MSIPVQLVRWRNASHASMCFGIVLGILIPTTQLVTGMYARAQLEHDFPQLEPSGLEQTRRGIEIVFEEFNYVIRPHFSYQ